MTIAEAHEFLALTPELIALLEAARVGETELAERATGYYWGEPGLKPYVEVLLQEAEKAGDDRLEQVARRFLR
jgi:hypothetical protein